MKKLVSLMITIAIVMMAMPMTGFTAADPTEHFSETFGTPATVTPQPLATSTTAGYNGWKLDSDNLATANSEGTYIEIEAEEGNASNNVLRLERTARNGKHAQMIAIKSLGTIGQTDTVKLSWKMKYMENNHNMMMRGIFSDVRQDRLTLADGTKFEPANAEQTNALTLKEVWHTYEYVINYTAGTSELYVDTIKIGNTANVAPKLTSIELLIPRDANYNVGIIYIDDITVTQIPDPEWVEFSDISNGQTIDNVTKDLNLVTTKDIYTIEWASDMPSVISAQGKVNRSPFFTQNVTLTATIKLTATGKELGKKVFSVMVAPFDGELKFSETFGTSATVSPQPVATSTTTGYNGWVLEADNLDAANSQGTYIEIEAEEGSTNNVLRMTREKAGGELENLLAKKDVEAIDSGKVRISWRMKHATTYHNIFWRDFLDEIRKDRVGLNGQADFTPANDKQTAALTTENVWHKYEILSDFDNGETTLYVDGVQIGDTIKATNTLRKINLGQLRASNYSTGTVYFDDFKIETVTEQYNKYNLQKVSFTKDGAFVEAPEKGGKLESIVLQKKPSADGNAMVITAFYDKANSLENVKVTNITAADFDENQIAEINVSMDITADNTAQSYTKIFVWDSERKLIPIENGIEIHSEASVPKMYLIGDSKTSSYSESYFPRAGIGQMLDGYIDEEIEVINCARAGEDTESYLQYSKWNYIKDNAKTGDYVFMEIGINDYNHDIPVEKTEENLSYMVDILLEKGVNVIMSSPCVWRSFDENGNYEAEFDENGNFVSTSMYTNSLGDYHEAIVNVIEAYEDAAGFHSIDMTKATAEMVGVGATNSTTDPSIRFFMHDAYYNWDNYAADSRAQNSVFADTSSQYYAELKNDYVHLTLYGADMYAKKIAEAIQSLDIPISKYIINTSKQITYPNLEYVYSE